jgi:hypothetical protein
MLWQHAGFMWGEPPTLSAVIQNLSPLSRGTRLAATIHAIYSVHCAYRYHRVVEDPWDDVGTMEAYMKLVVEQQTPLTYRSFVSQHGADNR